ncbi:hypothetical protein BDW67DRAFT_167070 [Aspergillus spinulosporus]
MDKEAKPVRSIVYSVNRGKCSGSNRKHFRAAIGSMQKVGAVLGVRSKQLLCHQAKLYTSD